MGAEKNGAQDDAISAYHTLLKNYPDHIPSHYNLARLLANRQQWSQAIIELEQVTKLAPHFPAGFYNLAIAYLQIHSIDKAIQALTEALLIYPDYLEAHQLLGGIAVKQQDWQQAHDHFDAVLAIDAYHAGAHLNKGILLLQEQMIEPAEFHLQQALNIDPTLSETYYHLGVIAQGRYENESAIDYFENAFDRDPQHFGACYNLGLLYKEKDQLKRAQHYFQLAKNLRPDDLHVEFMLAALSQTRLPITAPSTFVAELFDHYATYYDAHLNETLQYQVPTAFKQVLEKKLSFLQDLDILDLGCGTGLSGLPFKTWAKNLIGVDISTKMLEIAHERDIYTALYQQDILDYLKNCSQQFDLIIAADLLGYLGALEDFFASVAPLLKPNGYLVLSAEMTEKQTYHLQTCARFAYHPQYLNQLGQKNNLMLKFDQDIILRSQHEQPVKGKILGFTISP